MKNNVWILCLLFMAPWISYGQKNEAKDVQGVIIRFFDALSVTQIPEMKAEVTSDFQLLETGEIWNMDTLVSKISRPKPANFLRKNSFQFLQTNIQGNTAWVSYLNTATITSSTRNTTVQWLESAILRKKRGQWKMEMMHSTSLKK